MNKRLIVSMGIGLACLGAGCAKSDDNKNRNSTAHQQNEALRAVDLAGKSVQEVLDLKYNKAELNCALWVQRNQKLDLTTGPSDSIILDLKTDFQTPQTFKLTGQVQDHTTEVQIEINSLAIRSSFYLKDVDGRVYVARYSPYADYILHYKSATTFENGVISRSDSHTNHQVGERILDRALNVAYDSQPVDPDGSVLNRGAYRDYVHCVIDTEIKPEYQDQFEIQQKNP